MAVFRSSGHDTATILTVYLEVLPRISPLSSADSDRSQQTRCIAAVFRTPDSQRDLENRAHALWLVFALFFLLTDWGVLFHLQH